LTLSITSNDHWAPVAESVVLPPNQPPEAKVSSQPAGAPCHGAGRDTFAETPRPQHRHMPSALLCRLAALERFLSCNSPPFANIFYDSKKKFNLVLI
jgi:hypothetical protein